MFIKNHQYNSLGLKFVGKNFITNSFFFSGFLFHIQLALLSFIFLGICSLSLNLQMYWQRYPCIFSILAGLVVRSPLSFQKLLAHCAFFLFLFQSHPRPVNFLSVFKGQFWVLWILFIKRGQVCLLDSLPWAAMDIFFCPAKIQKPTFKFNSLPSTYL